MNKEVFLDKIVFGWIKRDLERMRDEVEVKENQAGNINFPLALCVLAYIEYLGGFLLGRNENFNSNACAYIHECFDNPTEYPLDLLRDIFRNGLVHEYFPRGGISRDNKHPAVYKVDGKRIVLDAGTLVNDFLQSLKKFKETLDDKNFILRLNESKKAISKMQEKHKKLLNSLPDRFDNGSTTSDSNRVFILDYFRVDF